MLCQVPEVDVLFPKQAAEQVVAPPGVSRDQLFPELSARGFPMRHQEWSLSLQVPTIDELRIFISNSLKKVSLATGSESISSIFS